MNSYFSRKPSTIGEGLNHNDVIVVAKEDWHPGVIGIVASRITDQYYKPSIVVSIEDGMGKGSCRSVEGFNIFDLLQCCSDHFESFGGHAMAAGISFKADKLSEITEALNRAGEALMLKEYQIQSIYYDESDS